MLSPRSKRALATQLQGQPRLEFYLAPPALRRPRDGMPPAKIRLGPWVMPLLRLLSRGKPLRGRRCDPFGHTDERRLERALVERLREPIASLLPELNADRLPAALEIARLPLRMRGYGHVKRANIALCQAQEAEWLHRFDPQRHPRPAASSGPGQLRGIRIIVDADA